MDQDTSDNGANRITSRATQLSLNSGTSVSVYPYEDVTALLDSATKDMKVGQLVQLETFSLFDAMCAIVIMDPKMDTGMILDDYSTRPQYGVNRLLNPKEFIWIFDNILIGKACHDGNQSYLFSCYILRLFEIDLGDESSGISKSDQDRGDQPPTQFVTAVLKSCVLAVAKSCGLIWTEMRKGQVYEEEDFMSNKFNVSLYENYPVASLIAMLDQAEYWMETSGKQWIELHYGNEAVDITKAVMERIYYSRSSFMALYQVMTPKCSQVSEAVPQLEAVRKNVEGMKSTYSLGIPVEGAFDHKVHRKLVTNTPPRAIALLTLEETFEHLDQLCADLIFIGQAIPFPDAANLVNFFIQFAAKKPAPGAFPRSILQTVLYENQIIMGTCKAQDVIRDSIQETVTPASWIFGSFDTLQAKLQEDSSKLASESASAVLSSILEVDEDPLAVQKRQIQAKTVLFVEKAIKPFVDTLQIAGQNASRQRRNLRKMVQLWEGLQEEAEALDEEIHQVMDEIRAQQQDQNCKEDSEAMQETSLRPFYFVSWAYHMKLWTMEWLLLLGFELELYSAFEYSMIYGYIDCVLGAHAQHLRRIQSIVESEAHNSTKSSLGQKKKKKKKKKTAVSGAGVSTEDKIPNQSTASSPASPSTQLSLGNNSSAAAAAAEPRPEHEGKPEPSVSASTPASASSLTHAIRSAQDLVTIRLQIARAVFLVLAALTKVGHLSTTPAHLASHGLNDLETLHRHRFKAFHHLSSPETMSFEGFLHRLECEGLDAHQVLEYATEFFSEAKANLDRLQSLSGKDARVELCEDNWRKDLKNMAKVCIASKIAIATLHKDPRVLEQKEFSIEAQKRAATSAAAAAFAAKRSMKGRDKDKTDPTASNAQPSYKAPIRALHFEWKYHSWWPVISLQ
ncbi:Mak10 subunit, NatC N-terminal acetyltransferase-domain-containing protein [Gamsiella multidivaricata]|uniref:Mak10 subunit, NatC N-terminal acetyltransferase-domain-containing protein n=1 Tax=Gamsiella multidivaricata TaxID=101098 RepID=UPI002220C192|nr:Mak10 subunit, NatC N-terminal acetyltransferase-domain-containing protein [Gamsiella multidivaricata]KAG0367177.1 hypothetical protein BGZ54_004292 [Gamsiella multidivaricata]KAI7817926.1 Mak10 subunit, NatC N-terminal acetyltransferase-domain-containing protein [Gamsiella multidivaricata]